MRELERQLRGDRAMRDAARNLVQNDLRTLQAALPRKGVGQLVKDQAEKAVTLARANPVKAAGLGGVAALLALLAWRRRGRSEDVAADPAPEPSQPYPGGVQAAPAAPPVADPEAVPEQSGKRP